MPCINNLITTTTYNQYLPRRNALLVKSHSALIARDDIEQSTRSHAVYVYFPLLVETKKDCQSSLISIELNILYNVNFITSYPLSLRIMKYCIPKHQVPCISAFIVSIARQNKPHKYFRRKVVQILLCILTLFLVFQLL